MTLCDLSLSMASGLSPCPEKVHWPNKALPSWANLEVPQPVSLAAWAIANETGKYYTAVLHKIIKQNNLKDFEEARLLPESKDLESLI